MNLSLQKKRPALVKEHPPIHTFSVTQFCITHNLSRATFYKLLKEHHGPAIMKIGRRTLISVEAASEWRARMTTLSTGVSGIAR